MRVTTVFSIVFLVLSLALVGVSVHRAASIGHSIIQEFQVPELNASWTFDHEGMNPNEASAPWYIPAFILDRWESFLDRMSDLDDLPPYFAYVLRERNQLLEQLGALEDEYKAYLLRLESALEVEASKAALWDSLITHLADQCGPRLSRFIKHILSCLMKLVYYEKSSKERFERLASEAKERYEETKIAIERALKSANKRAKGNFVKTVAKHSVAAFTVVIVPVGITNFIINLLREPTPLEFAAKVMAEVNAGIN